MSVIIGSGLVLGQSAPVNGAIIGYKNNVTSSNISATSEDADYPASNMGNAGTGYKWVASSAANQTITIQNNNRDVDYIGIARHNLNQSGLYITVKYDGVVVVPSSIVRNAQAILLLTQLASPSVITIEIEGATTAPSIAVLYAGTYIQMQRSIYVGHTPINYGRDRVTVNGVSENGQWLGEVVIRETNSTSVSLQNLTPLWYRETLDPFFSQSPRNPCFFAWRPEGYPDEVSYCWVDGNPRPSNQRSNGMVQIDFNLKGVV